MDRIRLGIIGCGGMASSHVSRFEGLEDRMTVTAACDVDLARAQAVVEKFPGAVAVAD